MLGYAPVVHTSAVAGSGLEQAMEAALQAASWRRARLSKRRLNEVFKRATLIRPLPYVRGARLQIRCVARPSATRCHVAAIEPFCHVAAIEPFCHVAAIAPRARGDRSEIALRSR